MDYLISQIAQAATRGLQPSTERLQRSVVGAAITAIFAMIALLSLFATGWFAAEERYGPVIASAYLTLAAALLALLAWAIVAMLNRRAQRVWEDEQRRLAAVSSARSGGTLLALTELPALVKSSPVITILSVAGIAYAVMKSRR